MCICTYCINSTSLNMYQQQQPSISMHNLFIISTLFFLLFINYCVCGCVYGLVDECYVVVVSQVKGNILTFKDCITMIADYIHL